MDDVPLRKLSARVDLCRPRSRPASPTKHSLSPLPFRPKAKVNTNATVRKLSSSSSLSTSRANNAPTPSHSRPASPLNPYPMRANGSEPGSSPKARVAARPPSSPAHSPESRQRALTAASAKLRLLPHPEDRPRSGSVIALHHALSISDLNAPSATPHVRRTNTPLALAPVKIKSKVTELVKSSPTGAADHASRSLSPPYATTRPIHTRARAPSITSSFSLNDPPPSAFYPITTASPAANPHRYAPRRALSPARAYSSPTLSSEHLSAKKSSLAPKVDPASVPLPPHSPPISALSLSSKSSVSRTSTSLAIDQTTDHQISNVDSLVRSMEWIGQPTPYSPRTEMIPQARRDRSRSREKSSRDHTRGGESDPESDGSERQLRAEAKTNRKIADLEITNRSLLAINASLETTRNRQAKEIRDLRRKLRESRLILPPRTFKAVKSAGLEEVHTRDDDDEDNDDDDDDDSDVEGAEDEAFQRVRSLIDGLVESGKLALETRSEDFRANITTKVLNPDELRSWRDSGQRTSTRSSCIDNQDGDDETIHTRTSSAPVVVPDGGSMSSADSEAELASDSPSALPPITITHSL